MEKRGASKRGLRKIAHPDSGFRKQGEGERLIIGAFIMFLVASNSKQLIGERMCLHVLTQETR